MACNTIPLRNARGEEIEVHVSYRDVEWNGHPIGWYASHMPTGPRGEQRYLAEGCTTAKEAARIARERHEAV